MSTDRENIDVKANFNLTLTDAMNLIDVKFQ